MNKTMLYAYHNPVEPGRWIIKAMTQYGNIYYCDSATEPTDAEMHEAWMNKRRFFRRM